MRRSRFGAGLCVWRRVTCAIRSSPLVLGHCVGEWWWGECVGTVGYSAGHAAKILEILSINFFEHVTWRWAVTRCMSLSLQYRALGHQPFCYMPSPFLSLRRFSALFCPSRSVPAVAHFLSPLIHLFSKTRTTLAFTCHSTSYSELHLSFYNTHYSLCLDRLYPKQPKTALLRCQTSPLPSSFTSTPRRIGPGKSHHDAIQLRFCHGFPDRQAFAPSLRLIKKSTRYRFSSSYSSNPTTPTINMAKKIPETHSDSSLSDSEPVAVKKGTGRKRKADTTATVKSTKRTKVSVAGDSKTVKREIEEEVDVKQNGNDTKVKKTVRKKKEVNLAPLEDRTKDTCLRVGAHVSIAGGVHNSIVNLLHIGYAINLDSIINFLKLTCIVPTLLLCS